MPVRPIPAWTSSRTSAAPCSSQAWRAKASTSSGTGRMPPSPCTGSMITAAVSGPIASPSASTVGATVVKPGTSGANGACFSSWPVAESAA